MQIQSNGQRGQQGRPTVRAERGEALIRQLMDERRVEIEAIFARDPDPKASYERAVGLAVGAYKTLQATSDKALDEHSAVSAALWAFQRKLDPGTEVYFVPYGGKIQPQISPQGLINLAHRSGHVIDCQARWVFQDEVDKGMFSHMLGSEEWVKHQKGANARPRSKEDSWRELAFAYAVIHLKDGGKIIEVHDRADIEYYRSLSKAKSGLWFDWPAEAARKAVLKQALGRAPKSSEVSAILSADSAIEREMEIPEDMMARIEARLRGEVPQAPGPEPKRQAAPPDVRPPSNSAPLAADVAPQPGDPKTVCFPGKKDTIADADAADLVKWEGRLRTALDKGELDEPEKIRFKAGNLRVLATIRSHMRAIGLVPEPHAWLDGTEEPEQVVLAAQSDTGGFAD